MANHRQSHLMYSLCSIVILIEVWKKRKLHRNCREKCWKTHTKLSLQLLTPKENADKITETEWQRGRDRDRDRPPTTSRQIIYGASRHGMAGVPRWLCCNFLLTFSFVPNSCVLYASGYYACFSQFVEETLIKLENSEFDSLLFNLCWNLKENFIFIMYTINSLYLFKIFSYNTTIIIWTISSGYLWNILQYNLIFCIFSFTLFEYLNNIYCYDIYFINP